MDLGDWLGLLWQVSVLTMLTAAVAGALFGAAIARWARFPLWVGVVAGVLVPIVGPLVAALIAVLGRSSASAVVVPAGGSPEAPAAGILRAPASDVAPARALRGGRRRDAVWLGAAIVATVVALALPWFVVRFGTAFPRLHVFAWGRAIDALLIMSILLLGVALAVVLLTSLRPLAVVLVIPVVAFWAYAGIGMAFLSGPLERLLQSLGGLQLPIGAALSFLGVDTDAATITLPDGIDPALLGLDGPTVELASLDLAAAIPALGASAGVGWYLMFGVALVLLGWIVVVLFVRDRAAQMPAATVAVGSTGAGSGYGGWADAAAIPGAAPPPATPGAASGSGADVWGRPVPADSSSQPSAGAASPWDRPRESSSPRSPWEEG